ncbi:hypothetical protein F4W66_24725 (plasmid) [Escherichia coli]|nr:hypothetical protein F4W66_24725 [Escherichia coli]
MLASGGRTAVAGSADSLGVEASKGQLYCGAIKSVLVIFHRGGGSQLHVSPIPCWNADTQTDWGGD